MWLTDPSFPSLVETNWRSSKNFPPSSSSLSSFQQRLVFLTNKIRDWNENHFGNIFQRKNRLLARLRGIQIALTRNPSAFLYSLEQQLIQEYNTTLHQEYLFWQLKSRIMWLNYGDANTKYFHVKILQCRSHSHIVTLKDETRLWLSGEALTTHILANFNRVFTATSVHMLSNVSLGQ